jgi:hypothetical protein
VGFASALLDPFGFDALCVVSLKCESLWPWSGSRQICCPMSSVLSIYLLLYRRIILSSSALGSGLGLGQAESHCKSVRSRVAF